MLKDKWLIVAFKEDDNEENRVAFETAFCNHLAHYRAFSKKTQPADPEPIFLWENIESLANKWNIDLSKNYEKDFIIETRLLNEIRNEKCKYPRNIFKGISVILNRDLFIQYDALVLYEAIVKHAYFDTKRYPEHFACCFGGVAIDCVEEATLCYFGVRCHLCSSNSFSVCTCIHTCYWHLFGLMLNAHSEPFSDDSPTHMRYRDDEIKKQLPQKYVYNEIQ